MSAQTTPVKQSTTLTINELKQALHANAGIVRLAPCWVPRSFLMPGGRLKLDPRDLYALGAHRGGIDERWFGVGLQSGSPGAMPREPNVLSTSRPRMARDAIFMLKCAQP